MVYRLPVRSVFRACMERVPYLYGARSTPVPKKRIACTRQMAFTTPLSVNLPKTYRRRWTDIGESFYLCILDKTILISVCYLFDYTPKLGRRRVISPNKFCKRLCHKRGQNLSTNYGLGQVPGV